jgi:hypothetical protein
MSRRLESISAKGDPLELINANILRRRRREAVLGNQ